MREQINSMQEAHAVKEAGLKEENKTLRDAATEKDGRIQQLEKEIA